MTRMFEVLVLVCWSFLAVNLLFYVFTGSLWVDDWGGWRLFGLFVLPIVLPFMYGMLKAAYAKFSSQSR